MGSGKYCIRARVETSRNLQGRRFAPVIVKQERREVERVVVKSLIMHCEGELKGDYLPLAYSDSYVPKRGGMSRRMELSLRRKGFLFPEPDMEARVAGCARHWPDSRGVYANRDLSFFVWCNAEDHVKLLASETGGNLRDAFGFMHTEEFGYLTARPSNLGSLRARVELKIPHVCELPDFPKLLER